MIQCRAARRVLTVGMTVAVLTALSPAGSASAISPRAHVWIESWSGPYVTVCAIGDVNDGATAVARWVFAVDGAVPTDIWTIGPYQQVGEGDSYSHCHTFYAGSPPDAAFTATLAFAGVGLNSDLTGIAVLVYEWNSALGHSNEVAFGSDG